MEVRMPVQIEFGGAVLSAGTIHVDVLNRVEEWLRKLRPQVEAALIDNAEAELKMVRADPASPEKQHGLITAIGKIVMERAIDAGVREAIHELLRFLLGLGG